MKRIAILSLLAGVMSCTTESEQPQPEMVLDQESSRFGFSPDNCLTAYYPFNGNADDLSGNGNDGTVLGPVLTSDRHGAPNSAYYFDGIDDVIKAPDQSQLHFQKEFTISAWVSTYSTKTQTIVRKGAHVNGKFASAYSLGFSATDDVVFKARPNSTYNELRHDGYQTGRAWYMMTVTYKNGAMGLYKNGQLIKIDKAYPGPFFYTSNPLLIGSRLQLASNTFKGKIDEVRLYCKALSPQGVDSLYIITK